MGKGRSRPAAPTEQTVVQSNLPKYFEPYAIDMIKRAETESKKRLHSLYRTETCDMSQLIY